MTATRTVDKFGSVVVMGADGIQRYEAPFGRAEGLTERMAIWAEGLARDQSLPWGGLGLVADVRAAGTALASLDDVRAALIEKGILDPADRTTPLAEILRVFL